jgi:hypothetical protein
MKYGEVAFVAFFIAGCVCCRADNARFCIHVVDERTGLPLSGMRFRGVFIERFLRWENAVIDHDFTGETNQKGDYAAAGKTNCGEAGFRLCGNNGFYDTKFVKVPFDLSGGKPMPIFQWWRPDNQVVTVELQRVEHPIPLWVKNAKLKMKPEEAAGYDGTNAVWRYDLMVGDWLPPAGQGKVPDLVVAGNYRFDGMVDGVSKFSCYEYSHSVEFPGKGNGVFESTKTLWSKENCPWFNALLNHEEFVALVGEKLLYYKGVILETLERKYEYIYAHADAYKKNFEKWDVIGKNTWTNPPYIVKIKTWEEHVEYTKQYLNASLSYLVEYYCQ